MRKPNYRVFLFNLPLILLAALILPSVAFPVAAKDCSLVKKYGFVHWETTGITSGIVMNRKKVRIQFAADSDALAVRALLALKWEVLAPNATGKSIILIGQLDCKPKFTPKCDQCAASEEYREFRLIDWYITTPFKVARWPENQLPLRVHINHRKELLRTDFTEFDGRETMDVKRFQRKVRNGIHRASNKRLQWTRALGFY
jgi:hypothetical protein